MSIELSFLHFLETIRTAAGITFFSFITLFGEELVMIAVLCLLYWCVDKRLGYRIGFSYFLSGLCVQTLKITFKIPRPWVLDATLKPVSTALETATGYSFPSGHTQSATALFGTLGLNKRQPVKTICCFILIGFVAFSRMYLGVHTPKDVLVSFFVSGSLVIVAGYIFRIREQEKNKKETKTGIFWVMFIKKELTTEELIRKGLNILGQIIKYSIGIGIAVLLKVGLKAVMGTTLIADVIRYFLLVLWVTVGFPYCIKKAGYKRKIGRG